MRLLALLLISLPAFATTWVESTVTGVRQGDVYDKNLPPLVATNSYSRPGVNPAGQWHLADVTTHNIPADVKAVFLTGRLVITHGTNQETCDLTIAFRAPGADVSADDWMGQAVEAHVGGGQRSGFASWVPVVDGKFEWLWGRSTYGQWPSGCAYGVFLYPQEYKR